MAISGTLCQGEIQDGAKMMFTGAGVWFAAFDQLN
jgi:hypothetical protein